MSDANAQQIEYWNGPVGERWADKQADIDRNLTAITAALMAFAAAKPGMRVLDLGCGAGTTALALAKAVAPGGAVTGVDISAPMLATARKRAQAAHAAVEFIRPTRRRIRSRRATISPSRASASCSSPIPRRRSPTSAARSSPAGGLPLSPGARFRKNIWAFASFKAAEHLLPPQEPPDPHAPGPFAFADPARVKGILARGGFRDIAIEKLDSTMNMGPTPEHAAKEALMVGPLARAATDLPEEARERIRAVVAERMKEFATAEGVTPPAACWLVRARV